MTIANAKPDLLITGPIGTSMVNAASSAWHDYLTVEAKITAAIAYAVSIGAKYCYVPDSFLPYTASLVTFNQAVTMTREGGMPGWYDLIAYGADPTGVNDSSVAIQTALNAAIQSTAVTNAVPKQNTSGGSSNQGVWAPAGTYKYATGIALSITTNQQGATLRWAGGGAGSYNSAGINGEPGGIAGELQGWGARFVYTGTTGDAIFMQVTSGAANARLRLDWEHLVFVGNKAALGGSAVSGGGLHFQANLLTGDIHSVLKNVYVMGAKDNGIWLEGTNNCQWYNVQSNQNGLRGLYCTQSAGVAFSPESSFRALECSSNGSHGMELTAGIGNTTFYSYTGVANTGKCLLLTGNCNNQRFFGIECEVNGTSPQIDWGTSNNVTAVGIQCVYTTPGTGTGLSIGGTDCAVYGMNTNSAPGNVDVSLTGGAHHNIIDQLITGDLVWDETRIADSGYANQVSRGGQGITGPQWPYTRVQSVAGAGVANVFGSISDIHFISITANVAITVTMSVVANPAVRSSQRLRIVLKNASGGALTSAPVFATGAGQFRTSGTFVIANNQEMGVDFVYDQAANLYAQCGTPVAVASV